MPNRVEALVVGAGISGLATAYALQKAGIAVRVVEAAARPGGVIQSVKRDGYLVECGPQSFSGNGSISAMCRDLGILEERVLANPKAPRYVLIDGKLQNVPMGPGLLASSLLSGGTRTAILRDILGKSESPEPDESVAEFIRRKFSPTLLDRLVGPFVSGIYAGDPEKLSLRAAFPILHEAEKAAGSVTRGVFKVLKQRKARNGMQPQVPREKATLQTFRDGNETLIRALAARLAERLTCGTEVTLIETLDGGHEPKAARFRVSLRGTRGEETVEAERLIVSVPTQIAGKLLEPLNMGFAAQLSAIGYSGVAVVSLGYRKEDVGDTLSGFGFLVPRSSGLSILGTVWNSSLFPGRAPQGEALLTSFVGGATNPGALAKSPEQLAAQVHGELTPLLGLRKEPVFTNVTLWQQAIPQYNLGHTARIAALESLRTLFPGLYFSGNYLNGPAIGTCVEHALKVADEVRVSFAN
ncbi:MAG TPA: protoporphyrinogen oxidase [Candidatus Sulfotelmatobacter sp.]|jgi:oxygen-dependent protoporphyrinogen oxidase|nr:protoporphyrinogen oxidase [Candidatus Sulfotelmatobacter sp.]